MDGPLQGSALAESLRSQVRELVERTLSDPDYAKQLQALVLADPTSPEISKPPASLLAALADIQVVTTIRPFAAQPPLDPKPLDQLPEALREFTDRVIRDKGFEQTAREVVGRVNGRTRSDQEDLYDLIGLFARTPEELSQLMPLESVEELLPSTTVTTTFTTATTTATATTFSTAACTTTTTTTTLTTFTTLSNFCPHEDEIVS